MRTSKSVKIAAPDAAPVRSVIPVNNPASAVSPRKAAAPAPPVSSPFRLWKDGNRRGIAYVEGREMAERVLAAAGRAGAAPTRAVRETEGELPGAMAVYRDKRGRVFAWQIPFDIGCWEQVASLAPQGVGAQLTLGE